MIYLCVIIWLVIGLISAFYVINTDRNIHYYLYRKDQWDNDISGYSFALIVISLFGVIAFTYTMTEFQRERSPWKNQMSCFYKYK